MTAQEQFSVSPEPEEVRDPQVKRERSVRTPSTDDSAAPPWPRALRPLGIPGDLVSSRGSFVHRSFPESLWFQDRLTRFCTTPTTALQAHDPSTPPVDRTDWTLPPVSTDRRQPVDIIDRISASSGEVARHPIDVPHATHLPRGVRTTSSDASIRVRHRGLHNGGSRSRRGRYSYCGTPTRLGCCGSSPTICDAAITYCHPRPNPTLYLHTVDVVAASPHDIRLHFDVDLAALTRTLLRLTSVVCWPSLR